MSITKKEERRLYMQSWREQNPEKIKATNEARKDKVKAWRDGYRESEELPYIIIYCIPNYNGKDNYVGITSNPFTRMINHKSLGKLNTEEYIELDRADTRAEAKKLEAQYHDRGYHGADNRLTDKESKI